MTATQFLPRSRQIELEDGSGGEDSIPPLTKAKFSRAPGVAVRDWVTKLIGRWLRQELSEYVVCRRFFILILLGVHIPCKHFVWIAWQNTAYHHNLVLIGTDKHMPSQPGAMWVTRDKQTRQPAQQQALKQSHYLNLLKHIDSPLNKGKHSNAHFALEEGSLPLRIITLEELRELCPGTFL